MKRVLYLGTEAKTSDQDEIVHYPVIRLVKRKISVDCVFTHLIFTSKHAVQFFFEQYKRRVEAVIIAVGQVTASRLRDFQDVLVAQDERQEGIIEVLKTLDLSHAHILLPRSSAARHEIDRYLLEQGVQFTAIDLYDPVFQAPHPIPNLDDFDEIVFTSPSTVRAFLAIYGEIPKNKIISSIGPITKKALEVKSSRI